MRKYLISFAQVLKFLYNIKLKGRGLNPNTSLRTPLPFYIYKTVFNREKKKWMNYRIVVILSICIIETKKLEKKTNR